MKVFIFKYLSLLLIVYIIAEMFMPITMYHVLRSQTRSSAKALINNNIDASILQTLKFTKDKHERLYFEHSKEFRFNNMMYDIVSKEVIGDTIIYVCYPDKVEKDFIDKFSNSNGYEAKKSILLSSAFQFVAFKCSKNIVDTVIPIFLYLGFINEINPKPKYLQYSIDRPPKIK